MKITNPLNQLTSLMGVDKVLHLLGGMVITYTLALIINPWLAAIFTACIGIAKELNDLYDYGRFDGKDLTVTVIGGFIPAILIQML